MSPLSKSNHAASHTTPTPLSRRRFVQGALAGAAVASCSLTSNQVFAAPTQQSPANLTGQHFDINIDTMPVNLTGHSAIATAVNRSVPGPTLRWTEGDTVTIAVTNHLAKSTSIHWHGIRLPEQMDGVPGLSFRGIAPGQTFHYRIPVVQHGTYWYHSHSRFQEQTGLGGALIIAPQGKDPIDSDREHVLFLSDWTDEDPETLYSNLKQDSSYYNYHRLSASNFITSARQKGILQTLSQRAAWARMDMSPTDIADVTGATYTYLINGNAPVANWTALFTPGEKVRLRIINGSSMTFFDVRIPGLKMSVVQADGNDVEPISVDEFRIAPAETYDVIVQPHNDSAYTIFAQSEDRFGYARGTLAPRMGMSAPVPTIDPPPQRTMMDMGMGSMTGMGSMADMHMAHSKATGNADDQSMSGMDMGDRTTAAAHAIPDAVQTSPTTSVRSQDMDGMLMGNDSGITPFPQPGPNTMPLMIASESAPHLRPSNPVHMHLGPQVDNIPMQVTQRLNDPGVGLSDNGRRVLTYADLRARFRGVDPRPPSREIELHLSGNMERYIWGFNGQKFSAAEPIELKLGERVRFILINDTMMEHPIHLHGMWSELENGHGDLRPYKHTIIVKPAERVSYLVSADTPGRWAYHCHLLYHMEAGMFRTVVVA
ncbi:MAG: copper resistance system multicopper oxidase [Acidobacteria bacterium]|nr:copper resistance system multicopper oxidase [Acidobacteriota bacterium]